MCVNQNVIFSAEFWLSNHIYEAFAWDFGLANKIKVRCDFWNQKKKPMFCDPLNIYRSIRGQPPISLDLEAAAGSLLQ